MTTNNPQDEAQKQQEQQEQTETMYETFVGSVAPGGPVPSDPVYIVPPLIQSMIDAKTLSADTAGREPFKVLTEWVADGVTYARVVMDYKRSFVGRPVVRPNPYGPGKALILMIDDPYVADPIIAVEGAYATDEVPSGLNPYIVELTREAR